MSEYKAYLVAVIIQAFYAGMHLISKAALDVGLKTYILVFYRQAFATIFLAPIAFFLEWKTAPTLTFRTSFKFFMISLFGITLSWNLNTVALLYTSASLGAAIGNTIPVFTFFLAVLFRMEKFNLRSVHGITKVAGIAICLGGAATIAFFNGSPYLRLLIHNHLFNINNHISEENHHHPPPSSTLWIKGVFLMLLSYFCWSSCLVFQGIVLKTYPSKLLCTTLQSFLSAIESFIIAIALERDPNQWRLGWNIKLVSVAYCGIVVGGLTFYLQSWVIEKKGPVFQAIWTPLVMIFAICSSAILFGQIISLGSVLGGVLLVVGLYCVLWGKAKEQKSLEKEYAEAELTNDRQKAQSASKDNVPL